MMILPPIGQLSDKDGSLGAAIQRCEAAVEESNSGWAEYLPFVTSNIIMFQYGTSTVPKSEADEPVVNDIQNAIIAATDIQTKDPIQIDLVPVETGEPPITYWAGPIEVGAAMGLPIEQLIPHPDPVTGEEVPPEPLDETQSGMLKMVAIPEELSAARMPGTIRPDDLVEMNDTKVAEFYQTIFDVLWERSDVDQELGVNLLDTNIRGWAHIAYDFDPERKRHILCHVPTTQAHCDKTARDVHEAAFAGYSMPMDASAAAVKYPDFADKIEEWAAGSMQSQINQIGKDRYSDAYSGSFGRPFVTLRVMWFRNEQCPMRPDEAIDTGDVVPWIDQGVDPATGMPMQQPVTDPETGEAILLSAATGQPTKPGDPDWPLRTGIRQLTMLNDEMVDDRECEHSDIPLLLNINVPLGGQGPYGFGEPMRLRALQLAQSEMLDAMVNNAKLNGYPIEAVTESMQLILEQQKAGQSFRPGQRVVVPDDIVVATGGQLLLQQAPPQMPPALPEVFAILGSTMKEQSGHTEVLQGRGTSDAQSGRAIELLQSAASSMIGFKSRRTGQLVKRLSKLMLHQIVWGMEPDDLIKIVSKYPRHVVEAFHRRGRDIEWNVKVEVRAGNGGLQMQKRQFATNDLQMGAISLQTYCEDTGRDYRMEKTRKAREMQEEARLMGLMAPIGEEGEGEEPEKEGSSSPSGDRGGKRSAGASRKPGGAGGR